MRPLKFFIFRCRGCGAIIPLGDKAADVSLKCSCGNDGKFQFFNDGRMVGNVNGEVVLLFNNDTEEIKITE